MSPNVSVTSSENLSNDNYHPKYRQPSTFPTITTRVAFGEEIMGEIPPLTSRRQFSSDDFRDIEGGRVPGEIVKPTHIAKSIVCSNATDELQNVRKILKPKGEFGRSPERKGANLEAALGWERELYDSVQVLTTSTCNMDHRASPPDRSSKSCYEISRQIKVHNKPKRRRASFRLRFGKCTEAIMNSYAYFALMY
jgi:hypothetical protein